MAHVPAPRLLALPWLERARVQRVDQPRPGLFVLTLYQKTRVHLLIAVGPGPQGVGSTSVRPKGKAASGFVQSLRRRAVDARVRRAHWLMVEAAERAWGLTIELESKKAGALELVALFDGKPGGLWLFDSDGGPVASHPGPLDRSVTRDALTASSRKRGISTSRDAPQLASRGKELIDQTLGEAEDAARTAARRALKTRLTRAERRAQAIRGDLARTQQVPLLRDEGHLLLAHMASIPAGAREVSLPDFTDPARLHALQLDPAASARENAERRFQRARRLERGEAISKQRLQAALDEIRELSAKLEAVDADPDRAFLPASSELPASRAGAKRRKAPPSRVPFRTFHGAGHRPIFVGKSAADNDTLTLKVARPQDHWLHARGVHGAHVIIPCDRQGHLDPKLLLDAAHLAAHFSDCRGEAIVDVQHTERRYVNKPKGAAKGAVRLQREKVIALRVSPQRLSELLASERRDES